jgi:hypothetical protein
MIETKRYIVLNYYYLDKSAISFVDKKSRETYWAFKYEKSQDNKEYSIPCLVNDIDGGTPLKNINYYVENGDEYLIELINPYDLKVYIASDDFKNQVPKYPVKKKELIKLAESLKETDNPILVMTKLKK